MRKIFSLIAAVLFAGSMFGADARLTLDFTQSAWGFPSANKKDAASYTNGGYTVGFGESNGGHKYLTVSKTDLTQTGIIFGKKDATLAFPALDFAVGKILVYYISAQGGANTVHNIFVGENAVSTAETGCKVTETKSYSTFNIAETAQAAGNVYVLKVTSTHNMQVSKVEFYEPVTDAPKDPTFSVAAGAYFEAQTVELACATEGATIHYTLDGTDPTEASPVYSAALVINATTTVKAIAIKAGVQSGIVSATYTILAGLDGDGSKDKPFSVADVAAINSALTGKQWVIGYIVGCAANGGEKAAEYAVSNIALGDAADQVTGLAPIQLPSGDIRTALNLVDNAGNLGKLVKVHGDLQAYFQVPGVKNVDEYEFVEEPATTKYCEFATGHLGQADFGDANGRILLTIQKIKDTNNIRVAIKNNSAAGNTKEGLNYLWVNLEGAAGVVRYGDGTHAEADVEEVSVIIELDEAKESYNFINIHWAYSGWEGEWAIDGLTVAATELCDTEYIPTAIDNTVVSEKAIKMFENGQLIIIKNGVKYNALGSVIE